MTKLYNYIKLIFMIIIIIQFGPVILKKIKKQILNNLEPKNEIGLISIKKEIIKSSEYNEQLKKYFKDSEIKAILLEIDCPGGAAGSSQAIADEILEMKRAYPKPIVTYSENICTAGAYFIAAMTDHIITTGSCIIGDIGDRISSQKEVKNEIENNFYEDNQKEILPGIYKNSKDLFLKNNNSYQKEMIQNLSNSSYKQLLSEISKKRHLSTQSKDQWAENKAFTGTEALKLKLIDAIGNQNKAVEYIKQNILHSDREVEIVTKDSSNLIERIIMAI